MKLLKLVLLVALLLLTMMLVGCQGTYGSGAGSDSMKMEIYHQRADGLRIPTYAYLR